jgi:phosphate transport system permease protein
VAIPLGTILAIYLSEFAPFRVRELAKPFLELLGGMPTIVYGYFALLFVTPLLQKHLPRPARLQHALGRPGDGHDDRPLRRFAVRRRDARGADEHARGSYAMGATRLQTALWVVTPAATVGHRLGLHPRHLARGRRNHDRRRRRRHAAQPHLQPAEPAATITAYIVQVALGDLPHGSIGYQTIFAAGLTLLLMTLAVQPPRLLAAQALSRGLLKMLKNCPELPTCARSAPSSRAQDLGLALRLGSALALMSWACSSLPCSSATC